MTQVHILVEGPTEETFINLVLKPHLESLGIYVTAISITTNYTESSAPNAKGGYVTYAKTKRQIERLLRNTSLALVTTMFDYFNLAKDFPGQDALPKGTCYQKVEHLEEALTQDIGGRRSLPHFLPYIELHEFEAILFSSPKHIVEEIPGLDSKIEKKLMAVKKPYNTPEEINDTNPPSYRLKNIIIGYQKVNYGSRIASAIGLEQIRTECPHFDSWLEELEAPNES
jgi:hypothetical protein